MNFVKEIQKASQSSSLRLSLPNKILFLAVGILLTVLIYYSFVKSPVNTVVGLILFIAGLAMLSKNKIAYQRKNELINRNTATPILNSGIINVNDNSGLNIQDNYIKQYITIEDRQVEIADDVSQTFNEFRDILVHSIAQSSNPLNEISEFAQKLTEELHKHPEVKLRLNADRNIHEQELVNNILKLLLTQNHYHQIQKLNTSSDLVYLEYLNDDEEFYDRQIIIYKGYKIHLHKDQRNRWHYKIQRSDLSCLTKNKSRGFLYREHALAAAKRKIRKDKFINWDFSTNLPI
jgi:hypothetical protein